MKETLFCRECGEKISKNSNVCPNCGRKLKEITDIEEQKERPQASYQEEDYNVFGMKKKAYNKWLSFFLALFLGWIGAHKFYEEKYFVGLFYALTGGFFGIGWLFDAITLFLKPNPYYLWK